MTNMNAKVTVRGTPDNPIFDFELPTGPKGEPGGWTVGSTLGTQNLNTITTPGLYYQSEGANVTDSRNYPTITTGDPAHRRGVLEVSSWAGGTSYIMQRYTSLGARTGSEETERPRLVFTRWFLAGGSPSEWSAWTLQTASRSTTDAAGFRSVHLWDNVAGGWTQAVSPGGINGQSLNQLNLNDVTTPGVYHQWSSTISTLERNYPKAGIAGVLTVTPWTSSAGQVMQEFVMLGSGGADNSAQRPRVTFQRYYASRWSDWSIMSPQRIDNTVGRAVYTWDDSQGRDQLIYGDTGYREMNTLLENGWTSDGSIRLRRTNTEVELVCYGLNSTNATSQKFLSIPTGFRPYNNISFEGITARSYEADVTRALGSTRLGDQYNGRSFIWRTIQPWPTAAPGTALGTIPAT